VSVESIERPHGDHVDLTAAAEAVTSATARSAFTPVSVSARRSRVDARCVRVRRQRSGTVDDMAPTGSTLTVRRVTLDYPDDFDPCWVPRFPEFAHAANGVSLMMPFAEPYFVKSIRGTLPDLPPDLQRVTADYLRQELAHHVQHRRFNELVTARYPHVARVERWMKGTYGWLSRTRSRKFNVAFAAGSETIAYALARWVEKHLGTLFDDADPLATSLFLWHLAEEVEHKAVAYDVFESTDGSRIRYAWASSVSLVLLIFFVWASALAMLRTDGRIFSPIAHIRLARWSVSLGFEVLPTMLVSALPGHNPSRLTDPIYLPRWLSAFDPDTGLLKPWGGKAAGPRR